MKESQVLTVASVPFSDDDDKSGSDTENNQDHFV